MAEQVNKEFKLTLSSVNVEYNRPIAYEKMANKWVMIGEDDNYYNTLIELNNQSALHGACVTGIANMIYGDGLEFIGDDLIQKSRMRALLDPKDVFRICYDRKLFGGAAMIVTTNKLGTAIVKVEHVEFNRLRPEIVEDGGDIQGWYYSPDFSRYRQKGYKPKRYQVWPNPKGGEKIEPGEYIMVTQPYTVGNWYVSPPDYQGGITYIQTDVEIGIYHLTNVQTGFSGSTVVQFFNGEPDPMTRMEIEKAFNEKHSGSSGRKTVFMYGNDPAKAVKIDTLQMSDADKQYESLTLEIEKQIFVAHRVTSPLLFGIRGKTGFSSNADELEQSYKLFMYEVVRKFRNELTNFFEEICKFNQYNIQVEFKNIDPKKLFSTTTTQQEVVQAEQEQRAPINEAIKGLKGRENQNLLRIVRQYESGKITEPQAMLMITTGFGLTEEQAKAFLNPVQMSKQMTKLDEDSWIEYLKGKGEEIDRDEYDLIIEQEVGDEDVEEAELKVQKFFKRYADPAEKSSGDTGLFKIRYRYAPMTAKEGSRVFCKNMVENAKMGVVYRKEDINAMSADGINGEFAERGKSAYSIWKYKGGVNCHHKWVRQIYFRKRENNGRFMPMSVSDQLENDKRISEGQAIKQGIPAEKLNVEGWDIANTRTIDLPNRGAVN